MTHHQHNTLKKKKNSDWVYPAKLTVAAPWLSLTISFNSLCL